jgi:hypothetical protein
VVAQPLGQFAHVALGAQQVVAGFGVAHFSQVRQRADAGLLREVVFGHAAPGFGVQRGVLVAQPVARQLGFQLHAHAGPQHGRR